MQWHDAPCEHAHLFYKRMEAFLNVFVLDTEHSARIFGKVTFNVQRLKCQQRGALHAHIMLWLDADSIDFATNSISAAIPTIDEHSTDLDRLLHTYVVTKQQHRHREDGCLANGHCKYCFPFEVHPEREASLNPKSNRWEYHRPETSDCMIVPYHPLALLLWGAHMNVQRVTGADWSFYLLKYAMKIECIGKLDLGTATPERLGLGDLPQSQLHPLNTMVLSRPVAPAEASSTKSRSSSSQAAWTSSIVRHQVCALAALVPH